MSDSKDRREIELLIEALDTEDVPDEVSGSDAVQRLGIDVKKWAADIRSRVARTEVEVRKHRFALAQKSYEQDLEHLAKRPTESPRSLHEQREMLKNLIARAPKSAVSSVHFHKFEEATSDELSEMIRSFRHLLGEDDE